MGYIDRDGLRSLGEAMRSNSYGQYLLRLLDEDVPRPDSG